MKFFSILILLIFVSGCASNLKTDELKKVKKVAIISLFANDKIIEEKGRGIAKNWKSKFKTQIAEKALRTFRAKIETDLGWEVVSAEKMLESAAYEKAFKPKGVADNSTMGKLASRLMAANRMRYFTPAGMHPVLLSDKQANTTYGGNADNPKRTLAKMAKALKVDALLMVELSYCYKGGTYSMLGTGEAVMTAGASIKAINAKEDILINMPNLEVCGGKERFESESSTAMYKGNLMFKRSNYKKIGKMLTEATNKTANRTVSSLKEEIHQ